MNFLSQRAAKKIFFLSFFYRSCSLFIITPYAHTADFNRNDNWVIWKQMMSGENFQQWRKQIKCGRIKKITFLCGGCKKIMLSMMNINRSVKIIRFLREQRAIRKDFFAMWHSSSSSFCWSSLILNLSSGWKWEEEAMKTAETWRLNLSFGSQLCWLIWC